VILMTGSTAEVFGVHIGPASSLPGGLWEVTLALWLILKGFTVRSGAVPGGAGHAGATDPDLP